MKNKSTSKSLLTAVFFVLVMAFHSSIRAQGCSGATTWIGSRGYWFDSQKWQNGCIPDKTISASVNDGGQAIIVQQPIDEAFALSLVLGNLPGQSGSVKVDGYAAGLGVGSFDCEGDMYIGNQGNGVLALNSGGIVVAQGAYVAPLSGSSGSVTIVGGSTQLTLSQLKLQGCSNVGLFIGCTPDNDNGGTATVNVSSTSTTWQSIFVLNASDTPSIKVGRSGTLTGSGKVTMYNTSSSPTPVPAVAKVLGTLAPLGTLTIEGNLDLTPQSNVANTVFRVTPQAQDKLQVTDVQPPYAHPGGAVTLGGRATVVLNGAFTPPVSYTLLHATAGRQGTSFQSKSIMWLSSPPPCTSADISYHDYGDGSTDVNLDILTSCADEQEP